MVDKVVYGCVLCSLQQILVTLHTLAKMTQVGKSHMPLLDVDVLLSTNVLFVLIKNIISNWAKSWEAQDYDVMRWTGLSPQNRAAQYTFQIADRLD